ncbi:MAG: amidohydrolase family protein [Lentisphaeria bacterium]
MIIDVHGHLGNINFAPFWQADATALDEYCRKAGVDWLCISSSKAIMYDVREGNADLDRALQESQHLLGYVVVNPLFPESLQDLQLLEKNSKFRGVKVHADYHGYDLASPRMAKFLDALAESGKIDLMLFHVSCMPGTGFADAVTVAEFAKRHPGVNVIMAHMAGIFQNGNYPYFPNQDKLEKVCSMNLPNVYIDTAHFLMYVYPGVMETMLKLAGAEKIVFGTDAPLQGPMQMRFAIEIIQALPISQDDKDKILWKNAAHLLKITL